MKSYSFVRVSLCRPKLFLSNVTNNLHKIIEIVDKLAQTHTQFVCFPELTLTGYTCGDLFHQSLLINNVNNALKKLEELSQKYPNLVIIVGFPFNFNGSLFNTAGVFNNGKLLSIIPKTYLPNYNEFKEKIYFIPALDQSFEIKLNNFSYPIYFGKHVVFTSVNNADLCFGIEICEDLWAVEPPSGKLALQGASIIFNLSASNDLVGKNQFRKRLIQTQSQKLISAYCYISSGLGESTMDMVFGGHGFIYENGKLLSEMERFTLSTNIISMDLDNELILNDRVRNTVWSDNKKQLNENHYKRLNFNINQLDYSKINLLRKINPHPFIPQSNNELSLNERCQEIINIQSSGLAMRFDRSNSNKFIIGLSGGLDSTHSLLIAIEATRILNLPIEIILAYTLPGIGTSKETKNNVLSLCKVFNIPLEIISIKEAVENHLKDIQHGGKIDLTFENAQARERTQILFDLANMHKGIVVGTGDLSEIALGWSTFNGDHMSSYNVNSSVPKTLITYLINWYIKFKVEKIDVVNILQKILNTPISPELRPLKNGKIVQKTEETIGPYEIHDFILYYLIRHRFSPKKILFLANIAFTDKYDTKTLKKWINVFISRFFSNQFKRSSSPDGPRVGTVSLSPRSEWRMPSDVSSSGWLLDLNED